MEEIIKLAKQVRENACVPYSHYKVGAVLKTKSKKLYTGCNIENNTFLSICAERVAFAKAISEGEKDFEFILIIGGKEGTDKINTCYPCGYCRQFMMEFVKEDFLIYVYQEEKDELKSYTIKELLPYHFMM